MKIRVRKTWFGWEAIADGLAYWSEDYGCPVAPTFWRRSREAAVDAARRAQGGRSGWVTVEEG
jgi:hypothetical protein